MLIRTFKGGIHPGDKKESTKNKQTLTILPPKGSLMKYPMLQHIGAPCEPIVSVGERVYLGQKIGEATANLSSPVHASVSGIIKEIGPGFSPLGIKVNCITIENDGIFEHLPTLASNKDTYMSFSREKLLEIIKDAGIVGLGGAGFPTHIKLNPPPEKKIDYVIVNASECEPYLTTDYRVLLEESVRIINGLRIILRLYPEATGIIATEVNKPDAIKRMKILCRNESRIKVMGLKTKYPQGAEKQLIYACTKRVVPSGVKSLPMDVGVIVNNVDTVIAVHRAVVRGRPLMRKIVTVAGGAVNNTGNYKVRLGMSFRELIDMTGGFKEYPYKVVCGGPMMGVCLYDLDVPIIKTSSAVLCFTKEEAEIPQEKNCIRCGKCVEHCPMGLVPSDLNQYVLRDQIDLFEKYNGLSCIECGSCSFICPSKRYLGQSLRYARRVLLARKRNY